MVKDGNFQLNCSFGSKQGIKSSLVFALSALLLVQPAIGAGQERAVQSPAENVPPASEISSSQPPSSIDELPSAPVPQSSPQEQAPPAQQPSPAQQQNLPGQEPTAAQQQNQPAQQPSQSQTPASPQQPVGTAAAPYEKPTGVSGSRPAGAAIAPAKQRRVRAIVISLGLVLAGAAAIGAVAGMSKASHSQP